MQVKDAVLLEKSNDRRHVTALIAHVLGVSKEEIALYPEREISGEQLALFQNYITRLANHEPVSKILGKRGFWNDEFIVTPDTLDPRPETETIIESVLQHFPADQTFRILDLGTGTGCLILSLLGEYKKSTGIAVDVSQAALKVAQQNAANLRLQDRVEFMQTNWCHGVDGQFDIIVSNPPYIGSNEELGEEVKNFDPHLALFAGTDGLDAYREIAKTIATHCHENALIFLEIGKSQETDVADIFQAQGFNLQQSICDLAGIIRCLVFKRQ